MPMKRNDVAILDFGSGKIVCLVGSPNADTFVIKASGQSNYSGFADSVWLEPEKLSEAVSGAVEQAENQYGHKIDSLLVGVPGEFTSVSATRGDIEFKRPKKITKDDISEVFGITDVFGKTPGLLPITRSVVTYFLDEGKKTMDPAGCVSANLNGLVSYIFVSKYFSETVGAALHARGIADYEFISSCLAEALFLLPPEQRDKQAILIDAGYISTSVMLVGGDGLMFLKSFSLGGGHISADMCRVLNISFAVAEELRKKINLNLQFEPSDHYILRDGTEIKAAQANEVAKARIQEIAEYIIACFDNYENEINMSTPLFITGGGLVYIKGAVELLSSFLKKRVAVAQTLDPMKNKPELASAYGIAAIAVGHKSYKRKFGG